jgi:hypothetical protein
MTGNCWVDEPPGFDAKLDLQAALRNVVDPSGPGDDLQLMSNAPPG